MSPTYIQVLTTIFSLSATIGCASLKSRLIELMKLSLVKFNCCTKKIVGKCWIMVTLCKHSKRARRYQAVTGKKSGDLILWIEKYCFYDSCLPNCCPLWTRHIRDQMVSWGKNIFNKLKFQGVGNIGVCGALHVKKVKGHIHVYKGGVFFTWMERLLHRILSELH